MERSVASCGKLTSPPASGSAVPPPCNCALTSSPTPAFVIAFAKLFTVLSVPAVGVAPASAPASGSAPVSVLGSALVGSASAPALVGSASAPVSD